MALVWQGPKTRTQALTEVLAPSLGQGLANFTGSYLANRALEQLISDPQYKNKPVEDRLEALQNKLSPYGQFGENVFNRRLMLEQQREQKQLQQKEIAARKVLAKEYGLPEESAEGLTAEQLTKAAETKQ